MVVTAHQLSALLAMCRDYPYLEPDEAFNVVFNMLGANTTYTLAKVRQLAPLLKQLILTACPDDAETLNPVELLEIERSYLNEHKHNIQTVNFK